MERTYELLTLSARTPSALQQAAADLAHHRQEFPGQPLGDLAYTLHTGRRTFGHRLGLVVGYGVAPNSAEPAVAEQGEALPEPRVAFLFTGQGAQYSGMGRHLYETCPAYRHEVDRCCGILAPYFPEGFRPDRFDDATLAETEIAQPALFVLEYALARLWMHWGVLPHAVMGHSLGEYVAACIAGALPLEEALPLVVARGRLMKSLCEPGALVSVMASAPAVEPYLSEDVCLSAYNAPQQVVLAGRPAALDRLMAQLDRDGLKYRRLHVTRAFHSPLVEPMLDSFESLAALAEPGSLQIPMVSNLTGEMMKESSPDARYWRRHIREPVRFAEGVAAAAAAGIHIFLEIGPHPVLRALADQSGIPGIVTASSLRRGDDDWKSLLGGLGRVWAHGVAVDWEAYHAGYRRRRVHAPTYPFEREAYWLGSAAQAAGNVAAAALQAGAAPARPAATEERLAALWAAVLGRAPTGPADDFFRMGGDSLNVLQLHARIRQELGVEPDLPDLFKAAAFGEMVALVRELKGEAAAESPLVREEGDELPLSFAQQRLWFLDQLESGSPFYNIPLALRLRGELRVDALQKSICEIVKRHEPLRTIFREVEGRPVQVVMPPPEISLTPRSVATEAEALELVAADARRPFDLGRDLMLRPTLLRLAPADHILLLTQHHIASDGWSIGVLMRELTAAYGAFAAGRPSPLPPLPARYADFAAWQRRRLQGPLVEKLWTYWKAQLGGELPVLRLPADHARPAVQTYRGAAMTTRLTPELTARLKALAGNQGATLFMLLLAAFKTLLYRYSGQTDIIIGSPIAGRPLVETEALIGYCAGTLALRTDLSGNPAFCDLLGRVSEVALGAFAHQEMPFEQLVEQLQPERNLSYSPIFQVMFALQNAPMPAPAMANLSVEPLDADTGTSRVDLSLSVQELGGELHCLFEYSTDLFDHATIERLTLHWQTLLESILANPALPLDELELVPERERRLILEQFCQTAPGAGPAGSIPLLAQHNPDGTALICGTEQVTYRETARRSNRLAHFLRTEGVGPEVLAGVCLPRTPDLVTAILAVLKAGGAYVPLDPNYPEERLAFMREDSGLKLTIDSDWLHRHAAVIGACPENDLAVDVSPENLAYVIYTSGSTGRPKGVAVTRGGVSALLRWVRATYADEELAGVLFSTSVCFDISVFELLGTLAWGGTAILAENALQLPSLPAAQAVRLINTVPSAAAELVRQRAIPASVVTVNLAGEALPRSLAREIYALGNVGKLNNLYGPTEETVYSTCALVDRDGAQPPHIGRPLPGTRAYILDRELRPVPIGVPGELCLGGAGLARGYLKRPDLTAERFASSPFGRVYRTGDLVRWLPDGQIEFLGRLDHQVKIRGFRVELGEVQEALLTHPQVSETVAVARDQQLIAYFTAREAVSGQELRAYLRERLPEYMIPAGFVQMEQLPRTPSGKVDRKALPVPDRAEHAAGRVVPRTQAEERLAAIWQSVLDVADVGACDDFFALGGHSLLGARLIARVRREFGVELPLRAVFAHPTVELMAAAIAAAQPVVDPAAADSGGPAPLSFAQQRLWFLDQFEAGSPFYNVPAGLRLSGLLDVAQLDVSLNTIVRRHDALRTTFAVGEGGEPVQVVAPELAVPLPVTDLSGAADPLAEAMSLARTEAARPFRLSEGPLIRALLLRLGPADHILLVTMHHIISDGWSLGVLFRELTALYAGRPLPPLPLQYPDFARRQRLWLREDVRQQQIDYWKERLSGAPAALELPTDHTRPPVKTYRGGTVSGRLSPGLTAALKNLSHREGATLFMTLLSAFQVLLHRYSGQDDLCVGTPVAGRNRVEVEDLIGFFISTVVMRADLADNPPFRAFLAQVRENVLNGFAHQDLSFEQLVEALQPVRDTSRTPLFQVMFSLQNMPAAPMELPGLTVTAVAVDNGTAKFDLTLFMAEELDGLTAVLEYNADLFEQATAARMLAHLTRLLEGIAANPEALIGDLPLQTRDELAQQTCWNETASDYPRHATVHRLFAEQARRTPAAVAVRYGESQITYDELNRRANRLAHRLRRLGVGKDVPVGIYAERSIDLIVGLVAALKAGGAYLPLDLAYPRERLAFMLDDGRAPVLLTQERLAGTLPRSDAAVLLLEQDWPEPDTDPLEYSSPEDLAYIIYTSGSTGRPKGVAVPHRAIVRLVRNTDYVTLTADDRIAQVSNASFDAATFEVWGALLNGGCLIGAGRDTVLTPPEFALFLRAERITALFLTTALFNQMAMQAPGCFGGVRCVLFGGEAADPRPVREVLRTGPPAHLLHVYGPTENTTFTTWHEVTEVPAGASTVPIGRPIANTTAWVLDRYGRAAPVGVPGELWTGGDGLARGYLNRPELTAERFVDTSFGRLYRTGDLVRQAPDGTIEYIGRLDNQVKIRGFRIEPGEVEAVLATHPQVSEAVVTVRSDPSGDRRLVAYAAPVGELTVAGLRSFLGQHLPAYMVPAAFVLLDRLPLNPNGKVDRKALPAPEATGTAGDCRQPPRTVRELQLLPVWETVLGVSPIGVEENFFELGGHSLLAVKLLDAVRAATGRQLPVPTLFQGPTIARQAALLDGESVQLPWSPLVPIRTGGSKPPFFCVHGGFGSVFCFAGLASALGPEQPFYGLQPRGLYDDQPPVSGIPEMAAQYIEAVRSVQPRGPYRLGGYCMGGLVALEMAAQLANAGEQICLTAMLDTRLPAPGSLGIGTDEEAFLLGLTLSLLPDEAAQARHGQDWEALTSDERWREGFTRIHHAGSILPPGIDTVDAFRRWLRMYRANVAATAAYRPLFRGARMVHFLAREQADSDPLLGWHGWAELLEIRRVPGDHNTMLEQPHVRELAAELGRSLVAAT